ncbi:MAG: hypothetical protein ACLVH0_04350 [Coprococcus eutactus]
MPAFWESVEAVLIRLSYEAQLALKGQQVKKLMDAVVEPETSALRAKSKSGMNSDSVIKMEFTFGDEFKDGPLLLACISVAAFMILFR